MSRSSNLFALCVLAVTAISPQILIAQSGEQQSKCQSFRSSRENLTPLASTCEFVNRQSRTLPNFLAEQVQTRLTQTDGEVTQKKVVSATLSYENGRERYSNVRVDGIATKEQEFATAGGFMTFGEFASLLNGIFAEESGAEFVSKGIDSLSHHEFEFHVRRVDNHWWALRDGSQQVFPELRGTLSVEPGSFRVRSLYIEAVNIPDNFPSQNVMVTTEYNQLTIPDLGSFWLPVSSNWQSCLRPIPVSRRLHPSARPPRQTCVMSSVAFENYRKFAAKSRVVPEVQ